MTPEENMIRLFQGLNQAYLEIAQFLTQTRTRRDQLIESKIPRTSDEVRMLQNVIESTEKQLGDIATSMRTLRNP